MRELFEGGLLELEELIPGVEDEFGFLLAVDLADLGLHEVGYPVLELGLEPPHLEEGVELGLDLLDDGEVGALPLQDDLTLVHQEAFVDGAVDLLAQLGVLPADVVVVSEVLLLHEPLELLEARVDLGEQLVLLLHKTIGEALLPVLEVLQELVAGHLQLIGQTERVPGLHELVLVELVVEIL